jgi:hypothetical protein
LTRNDRGRGRNLAKAVLAALSVTGISLLLPGATPSYAARVDADCTGTAADSTRIQSAIDSSSDGDEIVVSGTCMITSTIRVPDNRTLRGDSRGGTVLRQADHANLAAVVATQAWAEDGADYGSTSVQISNLTIDGNRVANTGTVGLVLRAWNSRVYNVEIDDAPGDGIRATSLGHDGTELADGRSLVNSIVSDVFLQDNGGNGIRVEDPGNAVTDWVVERSWISSSGHSGASLDNAAGWQLLNLHIYGSQENAIDAHRCYNTAVHDAYIEDFGWQATAGATYYGIHCTVQGDSIGSTIIGNKVNQMFGLPAAGAFVYIGLEGNYGTGRVAVTGNTVVGANTSRETGLLYAKGNATALTVTSTGNLVDRIPSAKARPAAGATVSAGL